jgi:hypothetical protein
MSDETAQQADGEYRVDGVHNGRPVSPLLGDYNDGDHAELNCPSCDYSILFTEIVQEGGTVCNGCGRVAELHITIHGWTHDA